MIYVAEKNLNTGGALSTIFANTYAKGKILVALMLRKHNRVENTQSSGIGFNIPYR